MRRSRFGLALGVTILTLWQMAFVAPIPVAADDPLPPGYVDCGNGFVCGGDGSVPGTGPIVVTGPEDRVVQGLYLNDSTFVSPVSAWAYLESEAKAYLAAVHQVPNDSRLTDWARDEIRAYVFARLLEIAQKPANDVANPPSMADCAAVTGTGQRACQDKIAYHTLKVLSQRAKIRAAQNAVNEYNRWLNDPCSYAWPAPLTGAPPYHGRTDVIAYCTNPNIGLFTGAIPPSTEEFTAVGGAMEFASLADADALRVTTDWNAAGGFLGGLGGAAVAAAIAAAIVATVPAVSSLFVTGGALVIFPFAAYGSAAAAAGGAAAGVGAFTAVLGIASAVFIAVVGVVLAGIAIWQQVELSKIIVNLQDSLTDATDNAPDMAGLASSDDGVGFLGALFTRETLPDYDGYPYRVTGTPAHAATDPDFVNVAHDVLGTMTTDSNATAITPKDWDANAHSAYITDGWWSDQKGLATPVYATRIKYVDWSGQNRYAGVAGSTFIHTKPDGSDSSVSPTINYLDAAGVKRTATLHRNEPPVVAPTVSGTFREGQPLTFNANASDPEGGNVSVTWRIEDPRGQLVDFVINGESTLQKCYTNPLNQGAVPGQLFFGCPWPTATGQQTQYTYVDNGLWHVNVVATDDHNISRNQVFEVSIANANPVVSLTDWAPPTLDEGGQVTLDGSVTDAGDDPIRVTVDWGDGTDSQYFPCDWTAQITIVDQVAVLPPNFCMGTDLDGQLRVKGAADPTDFTFQHTYTDDPPSGDAWPIAVSTYDDDGGSSTVTTSATVTNVDPTLVLAGGYLSPPGPLGLPCFWCDTRYGDTHYAVPVSGLFDDPGADDFTLTVDWGDGTSDEYAYPCADADPCPFQTESLNFLWPAETGRTFFKPTHVYQHAGTYAIDVGIDDGDGGANSGSASTVITAAADDVNPTITIATPFQGAAYAQGQRINAAYACDDETALASCSGSVANGSPIDTSTPGAHAFSVDATDATGNTAHASVLYHVLYQLTFWDDLVTAPAVNERTAGTKFRVRFSLNGRQGGNVMRGLARHASANCATGERQARWSTSTISKLGYSARKDMYYFVWKTQPGWAGKCQSVLIRLRDGTQRTLAFHFAPPPGASSADLRRR